MRGRTRNIIAAIGACALACQSSKAPAPHQAQGAIGASTDVRTTAPSAVPLVLLGENAITASAWTGSRYVLTRSAAFAFRFDVEDRKGTLLEVDPPITAIAGARKADVGAVLSANDTVVVVRGGRVTRRIPAGSVPGRGREELGLQLSDDGEIVLVTSGAGALAFATDTGERLGSFEGSAPVILPTGDMIATWKGVFAARGGVKLQELPTYVAPQWFGSRAVFIDETTLSTFDAKTQKKAKKPIGCPQRGPNRSDAADPALRRVVVDCRDRIVFLSVDEDPTIVVALPPKLRFEPGSGEEAGYPPPPPLVLADGGAVVISRGAKLVRVDPARAAVSVVERVEVTRSSESTVMTPCRIGPKGFDVDDRCEDAISPDGRTALRQGLTGFELLDVSTGTSRGGWGVPRSRFYVTSARVRDGSIEQVAREEQSSRSHVLRIGSSAHTGTLDGGSVARDGGCTGCSFSEPLPFRRIVGQTDRTIVAEESTGTATTGAYRAIDRERGILARVFTWPFGAVARFEDGKVELFGEDAGRAVVCLEGRELVADARCAPLRAAEGTFRLD